MRTFVIAVLALLVGAPAMADYYVAGDFNTWNAAGDLMTETSPGVWSVTLTGISAGRHEFKVTNGTWAESWPGSGNSWFVADETGSITVTYDSTSYTDGWLNATKRIGVSYAPETWTAVGDWQGWNNANPDTAMTPLGDGVYYCQAVIPVRTTPYQFKAVATGTWDAIGADARSINANTVQFNVTSGHTQWGFWVNALTGAVKARSLPESPVTVDGLAIPGDLNGLLRATQTNPTGFGDNTGEPSGSELDALYVARGATTTGGDGLYVGITGNLETNGNAYVILLDTTPGTGTDAIGALVGPTALTGLNGTILDVGFSPNWAITVNTAGGTTYVDLTDMTTGTTHYVGSTLVDSGVSALYGGDNPNNAQACFNNTNHLGVTGDPDAMGDAASAVSGLEMHIPFADLGITSPASLTSVGAMVILCKGDGPEGSYVSNQTLPGLGGGYLSDNMPRGGTALDFGNFPNNQFALVDVQQSLLVEPVIDGLDIPTDFAGYQAALQDNFTGWGDKLHEYGSELDQLFVGQDANGLLMGITGNCQNNGNFWLVFVQAGDAGSSVLSVADGVGPSSGVLQGLNGTTFDTGFAPTHVLCINLDSSSCHVDLVDLRTGVSRYLGNSGVDGGSGILGADNPLGAEVAFNNSNTAGVTDVSAASASTATTGAEMYLPFGYLGGASCAGEVKLMAWLVSNKGDRPSNQTLPPLAAGTANPTEPVDLNALIGAQFITIPITGSTFTPVGSVVDAASNANGTPIHLEARVSASLPDGTFFVQDQGKPVGLSVSWIPPAPEAGSLVAIDGTLSTAANYGLRSIEACSVTVLEPPSAGTAVGAIGIRGSSLGGAPTAFGPGVDGTIGPNNLGTLVRIWGRVTDMTTVPGVFYVDDGSGVLDGLYDIDNFAVKGVRVFPTPDDMYPFAWVTLTGISTFWTEFPEEGGRITHRAVRLIGTPEYYFVF